jgi:hypothetical protein
LSLDEDERERLRIENLITKINSGENSTLVLSTVASSVSIAIQSILFDRSMSVRLNLGFFGFLFALLGFLYRELTIHFSEMRSYRKLRGKLALASEDVSVPLFFRMLIVRWFLLLPTVVYFYLIELFPETICILIALMLSLMFAICELIRRVDC